MNVYRRDFCLGDENDPDDPDEWEEAALMPGMYITILRGEDGNCHKSVKFGFPYPHIDIAYFVTEVKPTGANVIDLAHNNSWFIPADSWRDFEVVAEHHKEIRIEAYDVYWYTNKFLMGEYRHA